MTKEEAVKKVVSLALSQIGYKEGPNNYNVYAADPVMTEVYGWSLQNQPWCAVYVNWIFVSCFNLPTGKNMTYGCSPSCFQQESFYKNANAWFTDPQVGDQVFFYVNGSVNHTGIVVDVTPDYVTTVEGNCSDSVCKNVYDIHTGYIAGYGRPNWGLAADVPNTPHDDTPDTDLIVDGECGEQTWGALAKRMPLLKIGSKGNIVRALQHELNSLTAGAKLIVDGDYGELTKGAVMKFQRGEL